MTKAELVNLIADVITGLDNALTDGGLQADPATWQLVYAVRKHLDDQQRDLLRAVFDEENAAFGALTAEIGAAASGLDQCIRDMTRVDEIVKAVTRISADVDQMLKLAA